MSDIYETWESIPIEDIKSDMQKRGWVWRLQDDYMPGRRTCDIQFPKRGWTPMSVCDSDEMALRVAYRVAIGQGYA
jgi:hypothetical protein